MDDSLLTKCPHCQTLFRIQQEHLAAADGEVRCGVCYKVFDAHNEGIAYSQGEGSPAEKTFSNSKPTEQADEEQVIDTSPEPNPLKALAEAKIDLPNNESIPSENDLGKIHLGNSSISDIVAPAATENGHLSLKWATLSLLAMLGLFVQWMWFNFEANAYQPQWHSLYANACETFGCELPPYQEISAIKTDRLAVKTHPDYNNVLIIDMIISNSAQYSQPLPILNMVFHTITGAPLAQRLFRPEEYLGKHLKNLPLMPSETPIHLSFAIIDPGNKAVNYSVNFAPSS